MRGSRSAGDLAIAWVRRTRVGGDSWDAAEVRGGMLKYFKDLEGEDRIRKLGKKLPKALAKAVTR